MHLNADTSKIDACMIKSSKIAREIQKLGDESKNHLNAMESALATRVSDEIFRGITNFIKSFCLAAPQNEVEKSLVS